MGVHSSEFPTRGTLLLETCGKTHLLESECVFFLETVGIVLNSSLVGAMIYESNCYSQRNKKFNDQCERGLGPKHLGTYAASVKSMAVDGKSSWEKISST